MTCRLLLCAIAAPLFLAGCGPGGTTERGAAVAGEPDDGRIECRIGNARQFERFCTVERAQGRAGPTLTLRKPDGGFRRLRLAQDGRGVVAADGAEPARVTIIDEDRIEVTIAGDSFRLPATVQGR